MATVNAPGPTRSPFTLGEVDERSITTVTLFGVTYRVSIDDADPHGDEFVPCVQAIRLGTAWHTSDIVDAGFLLQLNAQLRRELLQDAQESQEPVL